MRRDMGKQRIHHPEKLRADKGAFFNILNGEPDFSVIIISVSYLDACLAALLNRFLIQSSVTEQMLDPHRGSLGSFAIKADLAYVLGLIPKCMYQDLQQFAEIRNQVAHQHLNLNFADKSICDGCFRLQYLGTLKNGDFDEPAFPPERMPPPKERFKITAVVISNFLLTESERIARRETAA